MCPSSISEPLHVAFITGAASGLGRATALDHAAGDIRINAICPGIIDTE